MTASILSFELGFEFLLKSGLQSIFFPSLLLLYSSIVFLIFPLIKEFYYIKLVSNHNLSVKTLSWITMKFLIQRKKLNEVHMVYLKEQFRLTKQNLERMTCKCRLIHQKKNKKEDDYNELVKSPT